MTRENATVPAVAPCPWCLAPVAIRGVAGDPAAQFDPFLDDAGNLVGVRAGGHWCAGSGLYARVVAPAGS